MSCSATEIGVGIAVEEDGDEATAGAVANGLGWGTTTDVLGVDATGTEKMAFDVAAGLASDGGGGR